MFLMLKKNKIIICIIFVILLLTSISYWSDKFVKKEKAYPWIATYNEQKQKIDTILPIIKNTLNNQKKYKEINQFCKNNNVPHNKFLLTFDDWPHPEITPKILNILEKNDIKAIFFVLWKNAKKNPDILKQIAKQWHIIWNHSFSHNNFLKLNYSQTKKEIIKTNKIIHNILGINIPLKFLRPPYGQSNQHLAHILWKENMHKCQWNFNTKDQQVSRLDKPKQKIQQNIKKNLQKNNPFWLNILLHDVEETTPKILKYTLEKLKKTGYESFF